MKKKFENIFESIEVDPITGKYFLFIPEEVMNEMSWYEDTTLKISIEYNEVVLTEYN